MFNFVSSRIFGSSFDEILHKTQCQQFQNFRSILGLPGRLDVSRLDPTQ